MSGLVEQTVTIKATAEVWLKLFALMHYNGGHSATFGLNFDGDGADAFKIDPPPPESLRRTAQRCGDVSGSVEIATVGSYTIRSVKPGCWVLGSDGEVDVMYRVNPDTGERIETRKYPD